jgi:hypothetical protein
LLVAHTLAHYLYRRHPFAPHARTLGFCRMKRGVDRVARMLGDQGVRVGTLHGDMDQRRRDAVVQGARLIAGHVADLERMVADAPLPRQSTVAAAFVIQASAASGTAITDGFAAPVEIVLVLPPGAISTRTPEREIVLGFWNGSEWVSLDGVARRNADGSVTLTASVAHFTLFAVMLQEGRGTFMPSPGAQGLSLAAWGSGDFTMLETAAPGGVLGVGLRAGTRHRLPDRCTGVREPAVPAALPEGHPRRKHRAHRPTDRGSRGGRVESVAPRRRTASSSTGTGRSSSGSVSPARPSPRDLAPRPYRR